MHAIGVESENPPCLLVSACVCCASGIPLCGNERLGSFLPRTSTSEGEPPHLKRSTTVPALTDSYESLRGFYSFFFEYFAPVWVLRRCKDPCIIINALRRLSHGWLEINHDSSSVFATTATSPFSHLVSDTYTTSRAGARVVSEVLESGKGTVNANAFNKHSRR